MNIFPSSFYGELKLSNHVDFNLVLQVPYFIEELQVTDIHMGYEIPAIRNAGKPYIDERGFWVDLDVTYSGGFTMTIETKMNLMKLKKPSHQSQSLGHSVDGTK